MTVIERFKGKWFQMAAKTEGEGIGQYNKQLSCEIARKIA